MRRISGCQQGDYGGTRQSQESSGPIGKRPRTRESGTLAQTHSERPGNGDSSKPQEAAGSSAGAPRPETGTAQVEDFFNCPNMFGFPGKYFCISLRTFRPENNSQISFPYSVNTTPTALCPFSSLQSTRTT